MQLAGCFVNIVQRNETQRDQARSIKRREVPDPSVVYTKARLLEVGVPHRKEPHGVGRIEYLGCDTVNILIQKPGSRIPSADARRFISAVQMIFQGDASFARAETRGNREWRDAGGHEKVSIGHEVPNYARSSIAIPSVQACAPKICWLGDM